MLNWVSTLTDADLTHFKYTINNPAKEVPLLTISKNEKLVVPIHNFYEQKYYGRTLEHCD